MKRNLALCRQILLEVESRPPGDFRPVAIEGRNADEVNYHCMLLADGGYIEVKHVGTLAKPAQVIVLRLTWRGHDFMDSARDPSVWETAMKKAGGKVTSITLDVAKDLCASLIKGSLGLPP
jgi:hypothetical protein